MSTFQNDDTGNRIITDILTDGYLRQVIEEGLKISVPSEIKQLCFDFWFLKFCDIWDDQLCKHKTVTIQGETVKCEKNDLIRNVFGCHTVSTGQYEWKLNWKKVDGTVGIGVIQDNTVSDSLTTVDYTKNGFGICLNAKNGQVHDDTGLYTRHQIKRFIDGTENVGMNMKIDLNERSVYFSFNEDEYKLIPCKLKPDKSFRLVLTFGANGPAEVELK